MRVLESEGETGAARLVRQLGGVAETARELAYRLYAVAERKNRAVEALSYNALVQSWPEIARPSPAGNASRAGRTVPVWRTGRDSMNGFLLP